MAITSNRAEMIHKKCKTKMITIFLQDGPRVLTYCPKCVSPIQIKEGIKNIQNYETKR